MFGKKWIITLLICLAPFSQISYAQGEKANFESLETLLKFAFSGNTLAEFERKEHADMKKLLEQYQRGEIHFTIPALDHRIVEQNNIEKILLEVAEKNATLQEAGKKYHVSKNYIFHHFNLYKNHQLDFYNPNIENFLARMEIILKDARVKSDVVQKQNISMQTVKDWKILRSKNINITKRPVSLMPQVIDQALKNIKFLVDFSNSGVSVHDYALSKSTYIYKTLQEYQDGKFLVSVNDLDVKFPTLYTKSSLTKFGEMRIPFEKFVAVRGDISMGTIQQMLERYVKGDAHHLIPSLADYMSDLERAIENIQKLEKTSIHPEIRAAQIKEITKSLDVSLESVTEWQNWKTEIYRKETNKRAQRVDATQTQPKKMRLDHILNTESPKQLTIEETKIKEKMDFRNLLNDEARSRESLNKLHTDSSSKPMHR